MEKLLSVAMAFGFMIMPVVAHGQPEQTGTVQTQPEQETPKAPPVSQELVPEGDFALKLATALRLGTPETEEQAEDMLISVDIAPKNGWIADYPMTPIIIGQVRNALVGAAALKKLPMEKDEALQVFDGLTAEFGLSIVAAPGQYAEGPPPTSSENVPLPEIENYYYEEGPPIVTYYPPPWDYSYLYAWVPYPFWSSGFFFPGFFILHNFHHRHHHHGFHHGHHVISNHFTDPKTHASLTVDPTTKTAGIHATRTGTLRSAEAKRSAASIFNRSLERAKFAGFTGTGTASKRFGGAVSRTPGSRTPGRGFPGLSRGKGSGNSRGGSGFSGGSRGDGHGGSQRGGGGTGKLGR